MASENTKRLVGIIGAVILAPWGGVAIAGLGFLALAPWIALARWAFGH